MPEGAQTVSEIAIALTVDASQAEATLQAFQQQVEKFSAAARSGPPKPIAANIPGSPGAYTGQKTIPGISVPINNVTRDDYRAWRNSFHTKASSEPLRLPVTVNVASVRAMRQTIIKELGAIPVNVQLAPGSLGKGSNLNVLAALQSAASGIPIGQARAQIRQAVSTRGVEARQAGGPTQRGRPYVVGENGPEVFVPDSNGRVIPHGNVVPVTRIQQMRRGGFTKDWRRQKDWRSAPKVEQVRVSTLLGMRDIDRERWQRGGPDSGYLDELTEDIRRNGIREPVNIDYDPQTHSSLLSEGNHRLAVARRLGLETIPAQMTVLQWRAHESEGFRKGRVGKDFRSPRWARLPGRRALPDQYGYIPNRLPPSWVGIRRRGGSVRGYGGQYGSAKPAPPGDFLRYQERVWGDFVGEPGYLYHATPSIDPIRGKWGRRTGVIPTPQWFGMSSFWADVPASIYGENLLRTPRSEGFTPRYDFGHYTTTDTVPRSRLQYWGDDNRWHRFRRGRARQGGGGVEQVSVNTLRKMLREDREVMRRHGQGATDLDELTSDIAARGVQQPVVIHYDPTHHSAYVADGNHRVAAAVRLGMDSIPAYAISYGPQRKRFYKSVSLSGESLDAPKGTLLLPSALGLRWLGGKARRAGAGSRAYRAIRAQGPGGGGTYPVDPTVSVPGAGHALGIARILGTSTAHVDPNDPVGFLEAFHRQRKAGAPYVGTWWDPDTGLIDVDPSTVVPRRREADMVLRFGGEKAAYDIGAGDVWYASQARLRAPRSRIDDIVYGRRYAKKLFGGAIHALTGMKAKGKVESRLTRAERSYLANIRAAASELTPEHLAVGRAWYPTAEKWIAETAERYGKPEEIVRGMTAALSAGTEWKANKTKVVSMLEMEAAGLPSRYPRTFYPHAAADDILRGKRAVEDVLGHTPKTGQFFENTGGNEEALTLDRWAFRSATRGKVEQAGEGPLRRGVDKAYRRVAQEMGMTPAAFQASVWILEKQKAVVARKRAQLIKKGKDPDSFDPRSIDLWNMLALGGAVRAQDGRRIYGGSSFYSAPSSGVGLIKPYRPSEAVRAQIDAIRGKRWEHHLAIEPTLSKRYAWYLAQDEASNPRMDEDAILRHFRGKFPGWSGRHDEFPGSASDVDELKRLKRRNQPLLIPQSSFSLAGEPLGTIDAVVGRAIGDEKSVTPEINSTIGVHNHPGPIPSDVDRPSSWGRPSSADLASFLRTVEQDEEWVVTPDMTVVLRRGQRGPDVFAASDFERIYRGRLRRVLELSGWGRPAPGDEALRFDLHDPRVQTDTAMWDRYLGSLSKTLGFEYLRFPTDLTKLGRTFPEDRLPFEFGGRQLRPRRFIGGGPVEEFADALRPLARAFGWAPKRVGWYNAPGEKTGFAATPSEEQIDLNIGNLDALRAGYKDRISTGFWVPGSDATPIQYAATHEYGHFLELQNEEAVRRFRRNFLRRNLGVPDPWENRSPSLMKAIGASITERLGGAYPHKFGLEPGSRIDTLEPQFQKFARSLPSEYAYNSVEDWFAEMFAATQLQRAPLRSDAVNELALWLPTLKKRAGGGPVPIGYLSHMTLQEAMHDPWALMALTGEPNFDRKKKDKDAQHRWGGGDVRRLRTPPRNPFGWSRKANDEIARQTVGMSYHKALNTLLSEEQADSFFAAVKERNRLREEWEEEHRFKAVNDVFRGIPVSIRRPLWAYQERELAHRALPELASLRDEYPWVDLGSGVRIDYPHGAIGTWGMFDDVPEGGKKYGITLHPDILHRRERGYAPDWRYGERTIRIGDLAHDDRGGVGVVRHEFAHALDTSLFNTRGGTVGTMGAETFPMREIFGSDWTRLSPVSHYMASAIEEEKQRQLPWQTRRENENWGLFKSTDAEAFAELFRYARYGMDRYGIEESIRRIAKERGKSRDRGGPARLARDFAGGPLSYILPMYHRYANDPESHRAWAEAMNPSNPARMLREAMMFRYWDQWPSSVNLGSPWSPRFAETYGRPFPRMTAWTEIPDLARLFERGWYSRKSFSGKGPTPVPRFRHASGGPESGAGLYIVGEVGDELFVPNRSAHLIPPHVMKQIPKRAEGGPTGIFKVGKRGQEFFTPPEDGWIIPHRLIDEVPHAAGGKRGRTPAAVPDWMDELRQEVTKEVASRWRSEGTTPEVLEMRHRAAGVQAGMSARTPRGYVAVLGSIGVGRVEKQKKLADEFARASARFQRAESEYNEKFLPLVVQQKAIQERFTKMFTSQGALTAEADAQRQALVNELKEASAERTQYFVGKKSGAFTRARAAAKKRGEKLDVDEFMTAPGATRRQAVQARWETATAALQAFDKKVNELPDALEAATKAVDDNIYMEKQYLETRKESSAAEAKLRPGWRALAANFAGILVTTSAYGMAMQTLGAAMGAVEQASKPAIDSFMGWKGVTSAFTSEMGQSVTQMKGNLTAVAGATAASAGMAGPGLVSQYLIPSAAAKAGGAVAGTQQQAYRSMLALKQGGQVEGLIGGYGGLGGTSILASEIFGGGKGFLEQLAGTAGSLYSQSSAGMATQRAAQAASGNLRSMQGLTQNEISGSLAASTGTSATPKDFDIANQWVGDFNAALGRGTKEMRGLAVTTKMVSGIQKDQADQLAKDYDEAVARKELTGEEAGYLKSLASSGIAFADAQGNFVKDTKTLGKTLQQASIGMSKVSKDNFIAQITQSLQGQAYGAQQTGALQRTLMNPWQTALGAFSQGFGAGPGGGFLSIAQQMGGPAAFAGSNVSMAGLTGAPTMPLTTQYARSGIAEMRQRLVNMYGGGRGGVDNRAGIAPQTATVGQFDTLVGQAQSLGKAIGNVTAHMARLSAALASAQFANEMRLAKRALADALGFLGKPGGSRLGQAQREQFELGQRSEQLSINMERRSLATQAAMAAFATPGETGEERYARAMEALTEVRIKSEQVNISQQQLGLGRETTMIGAERAVTDTSAVVALTQMARDTSVALAADAAQLAIHQQELATVTGALSTFGEEVATVESGKIQAAVQYIGEFGGSALAAKDAIDALTVSVNTFITEAFKPGAVGTTRFGTIPGVTRDEGSSGPSAPPTGPKYELKPQRGSAPGYLGYHATPTTMTVGEAAGEQVAVLRNPSQVLLPPQGQQSNPVNVSVNINGTTVRSENDIQALAQRVAYEVERILGRKSQLVGLRGPSY